VHRNLQKKEKAMSKKQFLIVFIVAIIAGLAGGYCSVRFFLPKMIKAQDIRVIDKNGDLILEFAMNYKGKGDTLAVALNRGSGTVVAGLSDDDEPFLNFADREGQLRLIMGAGVEDTGMAFLDQKAVKRAALFVAEDGTPGFALRDKEGKVRARMFLSPDGTPGLELKDEKGNVTWEAGK
jgi:hypothetical protein